MRTSVQPLIKMEKVVKTLKGTITPIRKRNGKMGRIPQKDESEKNKGK